MRALRMLYSVASLIVFSPAILFGFLIAGCADAFRFGEELWERLADVFR